MHSNLSIERRKEHKIVIYLLKEQYVMEKNVGISENGFSLAHTRSILIYTQK